MLNTIKIDINVDNIMDMKKYVQNFINFKSPKAGELHIQIVTKREDTEGDIQDVIFCGIFVQKIWNSYNYPKYVDHYDIIGNSLFIENGVRMNISEDKIISEIIKIQENICNKYNDNKFIKYYAMDYFTDSRRYLYKGGQFCIKNLEKLTVHHKKLYTRVCVLVNEVLSLIDDEEYNIIHEESDIPILNFLNYLLINHCNDNDIKIIKAMFNNKNSNSTYKIPQLIITTIFSTSVSKTSIYNYSKEEQIVIKKAIHILRKYMKENKLRDKVKKKFFTLSTIIMVQKAKEERQLKLRKKNIKKAEQKREELSV